MQKKDTTQDMEAIIQGTVQVTPQAELAAKLSNGRPLKVKLGIDPTAPDLHLGHAVVLSKLRQFQDLGHEAILVIGDFTASIGDPTGRSKTRPPLGPEEIAHNMQTYLDQAGKILDLKKAKIVHNAKWLAPLTMADVVKLLGKITLARLIERDDFAKRMAAQQSVGMHELLYPILQAYDSVHLEADVELGGTDQTFNLFMGRFLQEQYDQKAQVVITVPLLEGTDGVQKMSKSLNNAICFADTASDAFGKLMSISDELVWRYLRVLLRYDDIQISSLQERVASGGMHPMALKKEMAHKIVARYWSAREADKARDQFESLFQKKEYGAAETISLPADTDNPIWIVDLLKIIGAVKSSSEARRLIEAGAVMIGDTKIAEFKANVSWQSGMTLKVGKHRIYKIA